MSRYGTSESQRDGDQNKDPGANARYANDTNGQQTDHTARRTDVKNYSLVDCDAKECVITTALKYRLFGTRHGLPISRRHRDCGGDVVVSG